MSSTQSSEPNGRLAEPQSPERKSPPVAHSDQVQTRTYRLWSQWIDATAHIERGSQVGRDGRHVCSRSLVVCSCRRLRRIARASASGPRTLAGQTIPA